MRTQWKAWMFKKRVYSGNRGRKVDVFGNAGKLEWKHHTDKNQNTKQVKQRKAKFL